MGFHPLFRFDCRRRSGSLRRALAPHQAKPGLLSGGVSSITGTSCKQGFTCRDSGLHLARRSGARKSGLHRIDRESRVASPPWTCAMGALGKSCSSCNLYSRPQNPAPEKPQRQPQTATEILCEVAGANPHPPKNFGMIFLCCKQLSRCGICIPLRAVLWSKKGELA